MSETSSYPGDAAARHPRGSDGAVVVLHSVGWKNPFLWGTLFIGIPLTIMAVVMDTTGTLQVVALGAGAGTGVLATFCHVALESRLEIRPDGFCEQFAFWRRVEHRWEDVGGFFIREDSESEDAVGYWITRGEKKGKYEILMGAYGESVRTLADRLNAARIKALEGGNRGAAPARPPR